MPSTLFLLLTILTAPAVPPMLQPVMDGRGASLRRPAFPAIEAGSASRPTLSLALLALGGFRRRVPAAHRPGWRAARAGRGRARTRGVVRPRHRGDRHHPACGPGQAPGPAGDPDRRTSRRSRERVRVPTVRLPALRIVGRTRRRTTSTRPSTTCRLVRQAAPEAEGILGQDVLAQYDYLIDHARQRLTIGRFAAAGAWRPLAAGVECGPSGAADGRRATPATASCSTPGADVLVMEARAALETIGDVAACRAYTRAARDPRRDAGRGRRAPRRTAPGQRRPAACRARAPAGRRLANVTRGGSAAGVALQPRVRVGTDGVGGGLGEVMPRCRMPGMPKCRRTSCAPTAAITAAGLTRPRRARSADPPNKSGGS